ncbi:MAG TPA: sensor histidine kinase [Pyrinomonadaceae bacterium]|nr:sensor histidine kinase [Pyrinomonadaceae bacterium]
MEFARPDFFNRHPWAAYPTAAALVALATGITMLLWLVVERPVAAPLFMAAIVVSTLIGGLRVGLFASALGGFALDYFFIQPFYEVTWARDDIVRWVFFVMEGAFVAWITEKLRKATGELKSSREELRELSSHQQTLREDEQKRIAREIHDELGQTLTGLKLDIHLIRKRTNGDAVSTELEELSSKVDSTIGIVRRIASDIRPSILDDFGLVAAIEWQAAEFERKTGVPCSFVSNVEHVDLDPAVGAAVFRIVQEALTNVTRHAEASAAGITVTSSDGELIIDVQDDGRGFDVDKVGSKYSLGLLGMRERARLAGADLDVRRRSQGGTTVELVIPLKVSAASEVATT